MLFTNDVNLHLVILDEHGCMRCTCNKSRRWGMSCPMITCTCATLTGAMFHVSCTKAYDSRLNTLKHPNVNPVLDNMMSLNRSNPGAVHVRDVLNMDMVKVNDNNGNLNDNDIKKIWYLADSHKKKFPLHMELSHTWIILNLNLWVSKIIHILTKLLTSMLKLILE